MIKKFSELIDIVRNKGPFKIVVANANDEEVLKSMKIAQTLGIAKPILVGPKVYIDKIANGVGLEQYEVIDVINENEIGETAVKAVKEGHGDVLMKGYMNTSIFMRNILHKEYGLRDGRLLSLIAAYEVPGYHKLLFGSDSGVNVAPDFDKKKQILVNAICALNAFGYDKPNIACLTSNELVDEKNPATVDAKKLVDFTNDHALKCQIEGPISFDAAFDPHAAKHKGIKSNISGEVDLMIFPNIETGNILAKAWIHFNKAKWGGIILGATHPIILGSRSDDAEVKINSIAMACLMSGKVIKKGC